MDKLPITEHLTELRKRIIVSLTVITIGFVFCFYYSEYIFHALVLPMKGFFKFSLSSPFIYFEKFKNSDTELVFLAPAEALWMHFKISFICGVVISSPVVLYEFWRFVAPGLLTRERKYVFPFIIVTTFLFLLGALFCFLFVLPFAMDFLLNYKTENVKPMLSVGSYIDFCLKFIVAFGAIFEVPVVMVILTKIGIVTTEFLAKNRKYAIVLAFVAAAVLTPTPDMFNQTVMAVPIIVMYEAGIWASRILNRGKKDKTTDKINNKDEQ